MNRRTPLATALALLVSACFAPEEPVDQASSGTEGAESGSSGLASTTTSATATEGTSGMPTTGVSTSGNVDPSSGGADTSSGGLDADCESSVDCSGGLLCLDGACSPCSEIDDADSVCAADYPTQPVCGRNGRCVACEPDACSGSTPLCDPMVGCVACTEHEHCPDSACHLGGPDAGSCFDEADVIEVQAPGAFAELLGEIGPGQDRVLVLGAATYTFPVEQGFSIYDIDGEREVAFLGNGATVLEGSVGANAAVFGATDDESQVYLSNLEWNGTVQNGDIPILWAGPAAELWIDDSATRGTLQLGGGEAHVRRSNLFDGVGTPVGDPDASVQGAGSLYLENASVDPALDQIRINGLLDIRYSTVVIAGDFVCGDQTDGVVRNSVVLTGGEISEACEGAAWSGNAVNTAGFGTSVPAFDSQWFAPSAAVRFRLSPEGAEVFGDVAEWGDGDPLLDAEGDERPTMGPSTAGVDEP